MRMHHMEVRLSGYVGTADAISKYFSDDAEWCRLSDEFHSIARDPGGLSGLGKERRLDDEARAELVKRALAQRENYLIDNVYQAVVRQELQVLLMDGSQTFQLPGLYIYDSARMVDALRSGWAGKLTLTGVDTRWNGARLVFAEADWRRGHPSHVLRRGSDASQGERPGTPRGNRARVEKWSHRNRARQRHRCSKEQLKEYIAEILDDRLRLRKGDFEAMCRRLGFKPNEIGRLWNDTVPEEWRKEGGGAPREVQW